MTKLIPGVALLWHRGEWVDAIVDEVARETCRFIEWDQEVVRKVPAMRLKFTRRVAPGRVAVYEDANGRRWKQRVINEPAEAISMVVKVEIPKDGPSAVITNKDKSIAMHAPISRVLLARMGGRAVKFFNAKVSDGVVELEEAADDSKGW